MVDNEYIYQDKTMERLVKDLKATLFEVIVQNEEKIVNLEDAINKESDANRVEFLKGIWETYNREIKEMIKTSKRLSLQVENLDSYQSEINMENDNAFVDSNMEEVVNEDAQIENDKEVVAEERQIRNDMQDVITPITINTSPKEVQEEVIPQEVIPVANDMEENKENNKQTENVEEAPKEVVIPTVEAPTQSEVSSNENVVENIAPQVEEEQKVDVVSEAPVNKEKRIFIKDNDTADKAILVNKTQALKLRASRNAQKAIYDSLLQNSTVDSNVEENDTKKQIEDMLAQMPALYEQGKTKEAEAMSEKISVLTKKINNVA